MNRTVIISPSGNLYGSEQVLIDFLTHARVEADVMVPKNSQLQTLLNSKQLPYRVLTFDRASVRSFYLRLMLQLARGRYSTVYLNEAGHAKYILLLAKLFPRKKFVVHVRIAEDTVIERWPLKPGKNVEIVVISRFIKDRMQFNSRLVYDPYDYNGTSSVKPKDQETCLQVGVIGRITATKGVQYLVDLLKYILDKGMQSRYHFNLFGDFAADVRGTTAQTQLESFSNVTIKGFVSDKRAIYNTIDCVLHLSDTEPLGRIFFEAIDNNKPLIGMNAAGIGEIGSLTGLDKLLVDPAAPGVARQLAEKLEMVHNDYSTFVEEVCRQKERAIGIFDVHRYAREMETLLA